MFDAGFLMNHKKTGIKPDRLRVISIRRVDSSKTYRFVVKIKTQPRFVSARGRTARGSAHARRQIRAFKLGLLGLCLEPPFFQEAQKPWTL